MPYDLHWEAHLIGLRRKYTNAAFAVVLRDINALAGWCGVKPYKLRRALGYAPNQYRPSDETLRCVARGLSAALEYEAHRERARRDERQWNEDKARSHEPGSHFFTVNAFRWCVEQRLIAFGFVRDDLEWTWGTGTFQRGSTTDHLTVRTNRGPHTGMTDWVSARAPITGDGARLMVNCVIAFGWHNFMVQRDLQARGVTDGRVQAVLGVAPQQRDAADADDWNEYLRTMSRALF